MKNLHGLLLIDKPNGVTSFHVIERLQRLLCIKYSVKKNALPKIGHGGTLDPFATGLLVLCVGDGVKLSRYLLDSLKSYEAKMKFGETTASGDLTDPVTDRTAKVPDTLEEIREAAHLFQSTPYLQTPPMHSAKKVGGKRLYELAHQGIEIERKAKLCRIEELTINAYSSGIADLFCTVTSGTYIRTLSQDLARSMGSLAHLTELRRTGSGPFRLTDAVTTEEFENSSDWTTLPAYIDFDRVLSHFPQTQITTEETLALRQGKQETLASCFSRVDPSLLKHPRIALYENKNLVAVALQDDMNTWGLERVFARSEDSGSSKQSP